MTPDVMKSKFLEIINTSYNKHIHVYTDGSIKDDKAGFGMYSQNIFEQSIRIHNYSSIYSSELLAIYSCLENLRNKGKANKLILIISDSKSALEGLKDIHSKNNIVIKIRTILTETFNTNCSFLWVPSHLSIEGNEKADILAKNSLNQSVCESFSFQHQDYKPFFKKYVFELWNDMWRDDNNNQNKLFSIQNTVKKTIEISSLNRKDYQKLIRLKTGHYLFTHKHIIEKTQPPICNCGAELTIAHLFNECNYLNLREKYNIQNLSILNDEKRFDEIKKYLTELDLFNSI